MQYQRLQAARAAAAAGQAPSTPVANGVPVPFTNPQSNAPTPSAQSTSHTSPAPQAIPQPVANSPITTQPSRPASSGSTSASNLQNPSMQKEANIDSKVPPPFETRPGSAASRKESVVVVEDVKGKGKAVEMPDTSIKGKNLRFSTLFSSLNLLFSQSRTLSRVVLQRPRTPSSTCPIRISQLLLDRLPPTLPKRNPRFLSLLPRLRQSNLPDGNGRRSNTSLTIRLWILSLVMIWVVSKKCFNRLRDGNDRELLMTWVSLLHLY